MKKLKTYENFLNLFKGKTNKEKLEKAYSKAKESYDKMIIEAGGEDNLSKGIELGYDNFGDFTSACFDCVEIFKVVNDSENFDYYRNIYNEIVNMCDKVNYVRRVSEYSVSQFSFIKRNLALMKNKFS